ncbi:MAG: response regulator [Candidatus Latescibacteria bacterium]|jgi:DNA-binding response OmpR family regulator|nr:response regulator [Candidatus Latescibacterota bacterium]
MARILVIEDDPFMGALLYQLLGDEGHDVVQASDGEEGMRLHGQSPADLLITDIVMPGKEGLATIREFQKVSPDVPIIAISGGGLTGKNYLPLAEDLGASRIFTKPFKPEDILAAIGDLLGDTS